MAAAVAAAAVAVQDSAVAEAVDPEVAAAPVGVEARAPVEAYGKRERPQAEVVAAEVEERVRVLGGQEAEAEKAPVAPEVLVEAGAEQVEVVEERVSAVRAALAVEEQRSAVRVVLAVEAPPAELGALEDLAAVGEVAALVVALAVAAPAADLAAVEAQVAQEPSLANG